MEFIFPAINKLFGTHEDSMDMFWFELGFLRKYGDHHIMITLSVMLKQRGLTRDHKISLLNAKEALLQQIRDKAKIRDDLEEDRKQLKKDSTSTRNQKTKL